MGRKKVSTTIYITVEQEAALKALSERTKVPVAEFIRQGIDMMLAQQSEALPAQLSLWYPSPPGAQELAGAEESGESTEK